MDKAMLFTFHQRRDELIKAMKRLASKERQKELEEIEEKLKDAQENND